MKGWEHAKMTGIGFIYIVLVNLWVSVYCGVFDHRPTVEKARCYANCLTLVGKQSLNDSYCTSQLCLQCKQPCDQLFLSLDDCNKKCKSLICKQSCTFIRVMKNWTDIYKGENTVISPPGPAKVISRNITSMTLSWQPPMTSSNGTVVYLLKEKYYGPFKSSTLIRNIVFLGVNNTVGVSDVCPLFWIKPEKNSYFSFQFTVVALTENSVLVEGLTSTSQAFRRPQAMKSIGNPMLVYDPLKARGDKLKLSVTVTPPKDSSHLITHYFMHVHYVCGTSYSERYSLLQRSRNISVHLYTKIKMPCKIAINVYYVLKCSTSERKTIYYNYKGCHNVPNFDRQLCCSFQPENTSHASRAVRNLAYSPLRATKDFRFNTKFTWQPPIHSCPGVEKYFLVLDDVVKTGTNWRKRTRRIFVKPPRFYIQNLMPGREYRFSITPFFQDIDDLGVKAQLNFNTTDVPVNKTTIQTIQQNMSSYSSSDWFTVNITWSRPLFNYSTITGYNVSYSAQGQAWKVITTDKQFFVVRGLDFSQSLEYQLIPIYQHPWIETVATARSLRIPDPPRNDLKVQNILMPSMTENKTRNMYDMTFVWSSPKMDRNVSFYEVTYTLTGYQDNELDCPLKNSSKRGCLDSAVTSTSINIQSVLPSEQVELTVKPVFANTVFFRGEPIKIHQRAPAPKDSLVVVRHLEHEKLTQTFNITWDKPLFQHSAVDHYIVGYAFSEIDVKSSREIRSSESLLQNITTTNETTYNIQRNRFEKGQQIDVEVTPVFKDKLISGKTVGLKITEPLIAELYSQTIWTTWKIALLATGLVLLVLLMLFFAIILARHQKERPRKPGSDFMTVDHWEVALDDLQLEQCLGEGAFGRVYKAILLNLPKEASAVSKGKSSSVSSSSPCKIEEGHLVAVKMLQDSLVVTEDERREFLKEIQLMKDVGSHRNIVNMLGCGTLSDPMFLIVEYLPNGDLLHYLRDRRSKVKDLSTRNGYKNCYHYTYYMNQNNFVVDNEDYLKPVDSHDMNVKGKHNIGFDDADGIELKSIKNSRPTNNNGIDIMHLDSYDDVDDDILTCADLMAFAWQVSKGMEFLTRRGYVHRDLAARNVLVGENKEAKIADFGLTRHMYNSLYQAQTSRRLPIKWMSIEAIFDQNFTEKSDVWSYGILLWELFTLGGTPYPTKSVKELIQCLRNGYRMEKPDTCDNEIYDIMIDCWHEAPDDRPTFSALELKLEEMMMRDNPYFDPSSVDESLLYYQVPSFKSIEDTDELDDDVFVEVFGRKDADQQNDPCFENEFMDHSDSYDDNVADNGIHISCEMKVKKDTEQEFKDGNMNGIEKLDGNGNKLKNNDIEECKESMDQVVDMSNYDYVHFV